MAVVNSDGIVVVPPVVTPPPVTPPVVPVQDGNVPPVVPPVQKELAPAAPAAPVTEVVAPVTVDVQARINRMYARLQSEREGRIAAEAVNRTRVVPKVEDDGEGGGKGSESLTQVEVEAIWDRKEKEKRFKDSETRVLMRHPDALNDDGTFNMNSPFTKSYIDMGRRNQLLAMMENGPEMAEAMVEKLGLHITTKPRDTETDINNTATGTHTGKSTVAVAGVDIVKLSDIEKKIAVRMGMTEIQYSDYKKRIEVKDKRVR